MVQKLKDRFSKYGITVRIVVLFTVLVIVPFLLFALLVLVTFQNYSIDSLGETTVDAMSVTGSQISSALRENEEASMSLYYNGCVEILDKEDTLDAGERSRIEAALSACCYSDMGVLSACVKTPYETFLGGGNFPELLSVMEPYEDEITEAGGACRWYPTDKLHGKAGENRYVLARSLNSASRKNVGILYMVLDDRMVTNAFSQMKSEYTTRYLTTEEGRVLYSSDREMFGELLDVSGINPKLLTSYQKVGGKWSHGSILVSRRLMKTGWYCISMIEMKAALADVWYLIYPFILIALIYVAFLFVMLYMMRQYVFRPLGTLKRTMDDYARGNLETVKLERIGIGEFQSLSGHFNSMSDRICDLMQDYKNEVDEKNRQRMKALTSQLTPHFIYNALNTIKWMAVLNRQENIQHLTESLIHIFMNAARMDDENYTVQDELALIENYAVIQKARFMNFDLIIEKDEACQSCRIRKLLLQPIVENAIVHGLGRGKIRNTQIVVKAWADDALHIIVRDEGVGFDVESWRAHPNQDKEHTNIGIHNVEQIIHLEYGESYGIEIDSTPGKGTTITYTLPVIRKEETDDPNNNR